MREYRILPLSLGVECTTFCVICTSCTRDAQENGAIGLVVLQSADILVYF